MWTSAGTSNQRSSVIHRARGTRPVHSGHWPATHATAAPTSSSSLLVSHVVSLIRARDCAPDQNDKEGDVGGRLRLNWSLSRWEKCFASRKLLERGPLAGAGVGNACPAGTTGALTAAGGESRPVASRTALATCKNASSRSGHSVPAAGGVSRKASGRGISSECRIRGYLQSTRSCRHQ